MAYGAEFAPFLPEFIYVSASRELISHSWRWPPAWHEAFQDAAGRLGLAVALYALDGRGFTDRPVALQLSVGSVAFRVRRRGTSVFVTVSDFTTSVSPRTDGPDATRRPNAADGLVLSLHGSDKGVYLVVFYGRMRAVPTDTALPEGKPIAEPASGGASTHGGAQSSEPARASEAGSRSTRTGESADRQKGKWSAIVWRTHTGSFAILPRCRKTRPHRWPVMDSALFGHAQSWLLH